MKNVKLVIFILFSTFLSFPSFGEWTKLGSMNSVNKKNAAIDFIDFERIRKSDNYIYFWILNDLNKTEIIGDLKILSLTYYFHGDCKMFRYKSLSISAFTQNMANGLSVDAPGHNKWKFPNPNTNFENWLNIACKHMGL